MAISVVIPVYEMQGRGEEFLRRALLSVPDCCEIVVSDDSETGLYEGICQDVKYFRNTRSQGTSGNLNNAIDHATGDIIKVLFQDDELGHVSAWKSLKQWGFCTSKHGETRSDHVPFVNPDIRDLALGNNSYGSPSALGFRRTDMRFDESLKWLLDCEFYARMQMKYGQPEIIDASVHITEWPGQATYTVATGKVRIIEANYINSLYADL